MGESLVVGGGVTGEQWDHRIQPITSKVVLITQP